MYTNEHFFHIFPFLTPFTSYTDRKKFVKIEIAMNIYSWGGVKATYHWNFNDIWVSLHPISKYLLNFQFSPIFFYIQFLTSTIHPSSVICFLDALYIFYPTTPFLRLLDALYISYATTPFLRLLDALYICYPTTSFLRLLDALYLFLSNQFISSSLARSVSIYLTGSTLLFVDILYLFVSPNFLSLGHPVIFYFKNVLLLRTSRSCPCFLGTTLFLIPILKISRVFWLLFSGTPCACLPFPLSGILTKPDSPVTIKYIQPLPTPQDDPQPTLSQS